jgi:hypothetical protein
MKTVLRIAAVLSALAIATPVLACSESKPTTAQADQKDASKAKVAKADKAPTVKTAPATR